MMPGQLFFQPGLSVQLRVVWRHPEPLVLEVPAERLHLLHGEGVDDAGLTAEVGGEEVVELGDALFLRFGLRPNLQKNHRYFFFRTEIS